MKAKKQLRLRAEAAESGERALGREQEKAHVVVLLAQSGKAPFEVLFDQRAATIEISGQNDLIPMLMPAAGPTDYVVSQRAVTITLKG